MRVVALESGPWRTKETFGGDELANVNRYNLWPDPLLNPRTYADGADDEAEVELFCPVPQMVGGGTVHWQGWLPRFTAERLPAAQHRRRRARDHAGRLADHLRRARAVLHQVEWAFGVSGRPARTRSSRPRSKGYPCPPLPQSRYAQKFHQGCATLGWNSFPTPQAALSRPYNGRPATVSAPSPNSTATRPAPDRARSTSSFPTRWPPAATICGRTATSARSLSTSAAGSKGAVYEDADGDDSSRRPTSSSWPAERSRPPG